MQDEHTTDGQTLYAAYVRYAASHGTTAVDYEYFMSRLIAETGALVIHAPPVPFSQEQWLLWLVEADGRPLIVRHGDGHDFVVGVRYDASGS